MNIFVKRRREDRAYLQSLVPSSTSSSSVWTGSFYSACRFDWVEFGLKISRPQKITEKLSWTMTTDLARHVGVRGEAPGSDSTLRFSWFALSVRWLGIGKIIFKMSSGWKGLIKRWYGVWCWIGEIIFLMSNVMDWRGGTCMASGVDQGTIS